MMSFDEIHNTSTNSTGFLLSNCCSVCGHEKKRGLWHITSPRPSVLERGDDGVQAGVDGVLESPCLWGGGGSVGDGGEGIGDNDGGGDDGDVVRQHGGDDGGGDSEDDVRNGADGFEDTVDGDVADGGVGGGVSLLGRAGVVLDDGDEVGKLVVREMSGLVNHCRKSFLVVSLSTRPILRQAGGVCGVDRAIHISDTGMEDL